MQRLESDLTLAIPNGCDPHPLVTLGDEQEVALVIDVGAGDRRVPRDEQVPLLGDDFGPLDTEESATGLDQLGDQRRQLGVGLDVVEVQRSVLTLERGDRRTGVSVEQTAFVVDTGDHGSLVAADLDPAIGEPVGQRCDRLPAQQRMIDEVVSDGEALEERRVRGTDAGLPHEGGHGTQVTAGPGGLAWVKAPPRTAERNDPWGLGWSAAILAEVSWLADDRTTGDARSTVAPGQEDEPAKPGLLANTAALVVGRLVIAIIGWSGTVLIARELSTEAFGQFTLVFSLLGMLSIVTDLGVGRIVIGGLVGDGPDRDRLAGTYILLRATLGLLGYGLAMAVVTLADYPDPVPKATAVAGLIVVLATPSSAYDAAFQVTGRLARIAVADTLGQLAQIALTIVLVLRGSSLVWYTLPAVLNAALVILWKIPAAHRLIPFRYRVDLGLWWVMLKEAVPLSAGAAFATLYYRVDSIMLASIADFEAVGLYGVAYKFVDLVHFIPGSLTVAILAPLAAAWPDRREEFLGHIRSGAVLLSVIGGGVVVGVWLFATPAVSLLYGEEFAAAGLATSLAVSGEVLAFGSALLIAVMISVGRQRAYPLITLAGLGVNVAANAFLIPRYSIEGAAVATLGTEALVFAILVWWASRAGDLLPQGLGSLRRVPLAMAVAAGVGFALDAVVPWLVAAAVTGALYLLAVDRLGAAGSGGLRGLIESRTA